MSIASYSRNVISGPRCALDARTNSEWIPLGRAAGRRGAATNQAAQEGYRVVRNGRISARNSAPGVGTSPQDVKKASRNLLSRLALQCRGDWIRTSDLLNPIRGGESKKSRFSEVFADRRFYPLQVLQLLARIRKVSTALTAQPSPGARSARSR